jgi:hypothetical protein
MSSSITSMYSISRPSCWTAFLSRWCWCRRGDRAHQGQVLDVIAPAAPSATLLAENPVKPSGRGKTRLGIYAILPPSPSKSSSATTPKPAKRGPAPKLQRQMERISQLPRAKQRFILEMIDTVLHQASR